MFPVLSLTPSITFLIVLISTKMTLLDVWFLLTSLQIANSICPCPMVNGTRGWSWWVLAVLAQIPAHFLSIFIVQLNIFYFSIDCHASYRRQLKGVITNSAGFICSKGGCRWISPVFSMIHLPYITALLFWFFNENGFPHAHGLDSPCQSSPL